MLPKYNLMRYQNKPSLVFFARPKFDTPSFCKRCVPSHDLIYKNGSLHALKMLVLALEDGREGGGAVTKDFFLSAL